MYLPLDGPAVSGSVSISASAEVVIGVSPIEERKMITVQPLDGDIYLSYVAPASPSNAFARIFENQYFELERSSLLPVYMVPVSGTVEVLVGEIA